jgi:hypothetical protein
VRCAVLCGFGEGGRSVAGRWHARIGVVVGAIAWTACSIDIPRNKPLGLRGDGRGGDETPLSQQETSLAILLVN